MRKPTKAAGNTYCDARIQCSSYNDKLKSREGASEMTGIDRTKLAHIELGTTVPYPEEVLVMADAYKAPQLLNYHCSCECPIGKQIIPMADICSIEQIAIRMCSAIHELKNAQDVMIEIAKDGQVSEDEEGQLKEIGTILEKTTKLYQELTIYMGSKNDERK